jgi:radical SAM superfamily enzyme YgiQ (UPF0313 family)
MSGKTCKSRVWLIQKGVWDMIRESLPLAIGYLKASALANEQIRESADIEVFNFGGGDGQSAMARTLFNRGTPDVMAFSVLGWNYRSFAVLAETFKQLNPDGWVVFGGNHVANQGQSVLRDHPAVDFVVNGEGELVFQDLLLAHLGGRSRHELSEIRGISYRDESGAVVTTGARPRIQDLSTIPSPILTNAVPLADRDGRFRYDVGLMETNRGCPYSCAFCYWGGSIGQKVRTFPRDRLREELEVFAFHKVDTVVLCDANFGMLPSDQQFVEDLVETRAKFGFPRALETSWAKNKSKIFYRIVETLRDHGMCSSLTLALQTLNDAALTGMRRRNMRVNDWEDLVDWLRRADLDCYAELIWGAPGETYESFLDGYDRLARHVPRIATYPLIVLPNTAYSERRNEYGLVTVRGERDDFEYVIATRDISLADNERMQRFLLWARTMAENVVLRHIWPALLELAGMTQSQIILSMARWFGRCDDPAAQGLNLADVLLGQPSAIPAFLTCVYTEPRLDELFEQWWREEIETRLPDDERKAFLFEVFRYDWMTRSVYDPPDIDGVTHRGVEPVLEGDDAYYVRRDQVFSHDVAALVNRIKRHEDFSLERSPVVVDLWYRAGLAGNLDNHEIAAHFVGQPRYREVATAALPGRGRET